MSENLSIQIKNLSKRFRTQKRSLSALAQIDLSIQDLEPLGLIGRNGSGKTTLLKILSGIYRPTSGAVELPDSVIYFSGRNDNLKGRLTVSENIRLAGALFGLSDLIQRGKVSSIADFAGLSEFSDTPLRQLSSGQKARLNFAIFRYYVQKKEPKIILLDEIISENLDQKFKQTALSEIELWKRAGHKIIVASHDLEWLPQFCPRAIWLEHGRVVADGPTPTVVESYQNTPEPVRPKEPLYIFCHVPKCGGTTIRAHLNLNFPRSEKLSLYDIDLKTREDKQRIPAITKTEIMTYVAKKIKQKPHLKAIWGHQVYYGLHELFPEREVRYVTFLRHPVSRIVSEYNHKVMALQGERPLRITFKDSLPKNITKEGKIIPFRDWVRERNSWPSVSFLSNFFYDEKIPVKEFTSDQFSQLKEDLNKFYFIGLTEQRDDFNFFYRCLGLKRFFPDHNISKKYFSLEQAPDPDLIASIIDQKKLDLDLYQEAVELNRRFRLAHNLDQETYPEIIQFTQSKLYRWHQFRYNLLKKLEILIATPWRQLLKHL